MPRLPHCVSNDNSVPPAPVVELAAEHDSQSRLRINGILWENIAAELPEPLHQWLHDGLDAPSAMDPDARRIQLRTFETTIVERLFPNHDHRTFMTRLRDHSRATALAAQVVADHAGLRCVDAAFTVGWLHDMGIAAQLRPLNPQIYPAENEPFNRLWPELLREARARSVSLASQWRLPSAMRHALREHIAFSTVHPVQSIAAATFVAEHLAGCMGYGYRDEQPVSGLRVALSMLRLSERDLVPMGRRAERSLGREAWHWVGS